MINELPNIPAKNPNAVFFTRLGLDFSSATCPYSTVVGGSTPIIDLILSADTFPISSTISFAT